MYPHERSLVMKFKKKPFVILGVISDKDRNEIRKVVKLEGLTWRSWWNDGGTGGHIAHDWGVTGWPPRHLVDQAGVIRYKTAGAGDPIKLEQQIAVLVKGASTELAARLAEKTAEAKARAANETPEEMSKPEPESMAAAKLKLAKMLAESGKADKARQRYQEIIDKYPKTQAAGEAKQLLSR